METTIFEQCEICGHNGWEVVYTGKVRDGTFGNYQEGIVAKCPECAVERLTEETCLSDSFYEGAEYRNKLKNGLDSKSYFLSHDELQIFNIQTLWPVSVRDKVVADIGCGGGSFLDSVKGISKKQIAVEPYDLYRHELENRGYDIYPYVHDAVKDWSGRVDLAFSFQVIEHTLNPVKFLSDIRPLLSEKGKLIISTPNLRDILFNLLPDEFPQFFYRVVHRWYFDVDSLTTCSNLAGYKVEEVRFVHRYGMSNMLSWLRDRKPTGHAVLNGITPITDKFWKAYLEDSGQSDCIYMVLSPNN